MNHEQLKANWLAARHWFACALAGLLLAVWPRYDSFHVWGESYELGFLLPMGSFQIIGTGPWEPVDTWRITGDSGIALAALCWGALLHLGSKLRTWALKESSWRGAATQAGVTLSLTLLVLGVSCWSVCRTQNWLLHSDNPQTLLRNLTLAIKWFPWLWMAAGVAAGLFVLWDGHDRPIAHKAFHFSFSLGVVIAVTIVAQPRLNQIMDLYGLVVDAAKRDLVRHTLQQP